MLLTGTLSLRCKLGHLKRLPNQTTVFFYLFRPKELICEMPIIQIIPAEASKLKIKDNLKTPVYVTQNRKNAMGVGQVFVADLKTAEHPSHWILQGVALVLNVDY
jgi:dynein heavy chain